MKDYKVLCPTCDWQGKMSERLVGANPFAPDEVIIGCPECKEIDTLLVVCDYSGCWKAVTCGTPTSKGYRHTCGKHKPKKDDSEGE